MLRVRWYHGVEENLLLKFRRLQLHHPNFPPLHKLSQSDSFRFEVDSGFSILAVRPRNDVLEISVGRFYLILEEIEHWLPS